MTALTPQIAVAPTTADTTKIDAVAVEYVLSGDRTASAVAKGASRLQGVAICSPGGQTCYASDKLRELLNALDGCPRIYDDAVLARVVERRYGLPMVDAFDDVRIMSRLLQVSEVERCSWDYPDTGVGRCQRILREFLTLSPLLSLHGLTSTYAGIERPLVDSVAKMIEIGVQVETNLLEEIKDSTLQQLEFLRSRIRQIVGTSLNPDDAEKVRDFLFRECGLPVITRTENGNPSSSGAVLERLVHRHPVIPYIRQYRTMRTNDSAATSLLEHVSSDSTIHANLDSLGCVTGRFTCCSPNLQGMPRVVLGAVRARPNHTLIELDISQAELRVLAHVTRDPRLVAAYTTEHADLHRRTASLILDIPECEVTTQQRDDFGKCINFAVVYGKTEYSLAEDLGVSLEQARAFIEAYFQRYPQVKCWNDYVRSKAVQELEVRTEYDRRRLLPELRSH